MRGDEARKVRACFLHLARFRLVGLVVGLKRFEVIGEVGLPPIEPKLPAVCDQLPFSERFSLGVSPAPVTPLPFFFTSWMPWIAACSTRHACTTPSEKGRAG